MFHNRFSIYAPNDFNVRILFLPYLVFIRYTIILKQIDVLLVM